MVDITLVLKKHDNPKTPWNEVGDIVGIELMSDGHPSTEKFYLIHITGVPNIGVAKLKRLRDKLLEFDYVGTGEFDPKTGAENLVLRNSRRWHVHPRALPTGMRNQLIADGEITVTWTQAKSRLRRKIARVLSRTVHNDLDSEPITDLDVTEA